MRCWPDNEGWADDDGWAARAAVAVRGVAFAPLLALVACSGGEGPEGSGPGAFMPGSSTAGSGGTTLPPADPAPGVSNYERPLGMPIGQAPPEPGASPSGEVPGATPDDDIEAGEDIEIPVFMPEEEPPPCSGCVELNVDVNDINQRNSFVFSGGGANVTRVVWTIIVPFNSDQLFVQPFVDNNFGTFTDLDANAFAVDTPAQLVHQYSGTAGTVGIAIGSSGAWTGNMTMSVFVDSVTLEGADASASRTFDNDVQGLLVASTTYNARIVYHP
jgi:hypothetical protein